MVALLLAHKPELVDPYALYVAASQGHHHVVALLLEHCPDLINEKNFEYRGKNVLHVAATGGHMKLIVDLLPRCSFLDDVDLEGRTPLFCAAHEGHEEVVELLFPLTLGQVSF